MNQQDETESRPDSASETDTADQQNGNETDAVTDSAAESPADKAGGTGAADTPAKSKSGGGTAFIALMVALLAAAGTGYQWLTQRGQGGLNQQVADIRASTGSAQARLKDDLNSIAAETDRVEEQLKTLAASIEEEMQVLPMRIDALEQTVTNLPGVSANARAAWLRAEVEYLLRIANVQLNLAGNVDAASKALDLADQKLGTLANPGLTRVRAQVADERAALASVPRPDLEGVVLAIGSLAKSLDTMPLSESAPGQFGRDRKSDASESGLARAWRVVVDALLSIISVKRNDETVTPLMSQSDQSMLIRSLDIELQIARLAAIRNEARLYQGALQGVADRLEQYFDTDADEVQNALRTIEELRQIDLAESLPDISASLALLMQLNNQDRAL